MHTFFFLWLYSPVWTLASLKMQPQIFQLSAFFHRVSTFNNLTSFKTLSSYLNLGLPFFREPSCCEKVIFLQGEFSSILTKYPSHLILIMHTHVCEKCKFVSFIDSPLYSIVYISVIFQYRVSFLFLQFACILPSILQQEK
jgi:hypothetical protein